MNPNLEQRIAALEKWKQEKEAQQIKFPLDIQSQTILNKYLLSKIATIEFSAGVSSDLYKYILVEQDGKIDALGSVRNFSQFTVNTTADTLILVSARFENNNGVTVISTGTAPGGLMSGGTYYVVNASSGGTTIQLSATLGGAAINITSVGTGEQYIYYVL